jgi:hypothetical protein
VESGQLARDPRGGGRLVAADGPPRGSNEQIQAASQIVFEDRRRPGPFRFSDELILTPAPPGQISGSRLFAGIAPRNLGGMRVDGRPPLAYRAHSKTNEDGS